MTFNTVATHIRHRILILIIQDIIQHADVRLRLDGDSGAHAEAVDVLDELLGVGLFVAGGFGGVGGGGVDGGLVVEAVKVAAGLLEVLDPFLWLLELVSWLFMSCKWSL